SCSFSNREIHVCASGGHAESEQSQVLSRPASARERHHGFSDPDVGVEAVSARRVVVQNRRHQVGVLWPGLCTVTKLDDEIDWKLLKPEIFAAIIDFYSTGLPVLREGATDEVNASTTGKCLFSI